MTLRRRWGCVFLLVLTGLVLLVALLGVRPGWHLYRTWRDDVRTVAPARPGTVDDASRLNETTVSQVLNVPDDRALAEQQLRELLSRANRENLRVSIAGARHSMGGHTIYPGGIAINMLPFNHFTLDETTSVLHVGAGALWRDILPYLNARGKSIAVMQSNSSFSVGGSLSVNCHGWQAGMPPIASTVESFRLMKPDGGIVVCSRKNNADLFSLALGGYGLFGIILDADLRVVSNEMLRLVRRRVATADYPETYRSCVEKNPAAVMAYGRLDISPPGNLSAALLNVWERAPGEQCTTAPIPPMPAPALLRTIFRGSVGSAYGKQLRWFAEEQIEPQVGLDRASRNQLLDVPADWYANRSTADTDVLHEYFVPPGRFADFVTATREIVARHKADLLNITVREVEPDPDTFLRYADKPMFGLVMLFNQARTAAGEASMQALTRELIDAALKCDGRFYLPYRLHATQAQVRQAYPMIDRFLARKRAVDPQEIFQNEFYRKYSATD